MHTLFLLNPAAGKADCTRTLPQQIAAAAAGAGLAPEDYTIRVTTHAGHARELSRAAAAAAQKAGVEMPISQAAYEVLYEGRDPKLVVTDLMGRAKRSELDESWS